MIHQATAQRHSSRPHRRGVSLMEVLIATFVLSIGLLGVASLIPVGQRSLVEANKFDRGGHVGRAALHDVKVRRMFDFRTWSSPPAPDSTDTAVYMIDPLGLAPAAGVTKIAVNNVPSTAYKSFDDLIFELPNDKNARPVKVVGTDGSAQAWQNYSWLCTIVPASTEKSVPWALKTQFDVSVAVVCKGSGSAQSGSISFTGGGYGGGGVSLSDSVKLKQNEWVLVVGTGQARWYRVVQTGSKATLFGPDWNTAVSSSATLIAIPGCVGVYTQTMEVDRDPSWAPPEL